MATNYKLTNNECLTRNS